MINKERFKIGDVVWCKMPNHTDYKAFPGLRRRLNNRPFYGIIVGWTYRRNGEIFPDDEGNIFIHAEKPSKFVWLVREKPNGRQYDVPDELADGLPKDQPLPIEVAS